MKLTVEQLRATLTEDQAFNEILALAKTYKFPATAFQSGSIGYTLLKVMGACLAIQSDSIKQSVDATFITTATGDYCTMRASSDFSEERFVASQTVIKTKIDIVDATPETYTEGEIKIKIDGKEFYLSKTLDVTIDGSYYPEFTSTLYGASSRPNTGITPVFTENPIPNAEFILISNDIGYFETLKEGQDEETDDDLKLRCTKKWGTLAFNGPEDKYLYWIKNTVTPSGEPTDITKIKVDSSSAQAVGMVLIYCATANGVPSSESIGYADANVQKYRDNCATVTLIPAELSVVSYQLTVTVNGTATDDTTLKANIKDIITKYYANLSIGGTILNQDKGYVVYQEIVSEIMSLTGVLNVDFVSSKKGSDPESTTVDDVELNTYEIATVDVNQAGMITIKRVK